jgi:hypothetical protein
MIDAEAYSGQAKTRRTGLMRPDTNGTTPAEDAEPDDAVVQLAAALRTAERAHRAYVAELLLGDVRPSEEWSTWYAEYLLGLR